MSKFGEPWARITCDEERIYIEMDEGSCHDAGSGVGRGPMDPLLKRALACVNSLSGIPDPVAFVAAVREVVSFAPHGDNLDPAFVAALRRLGEVMNG